MKRWEQSPRSLEERFLDYLGSMNFDEKLTFMTFGNTELSVALMRDHVMNETEIGRTLLDMFADELEDGVPSVQCRIGGHEIFEPVMGGLLHPGSGEIRNETSNAVSTCIGPVCRLHLPELVPLQDRAFLSLQKDRISADPYTLQKRTKLVAWRESPYYQDEQE